MEITNHRLTAGAPVTFVQSPNQGGPCNPTVIVIHYTAGRSFERSLRTLTLKDSGVSAHCLVGKGGEFAQMVPFHRQAWHAGDSLWRGLQHVNAFGIGIELDNFGPLKKSDSGKWLTHFGAEVDPKSVKELSHKFGTQIRGWETYPVRQIATLFTICSALLEEYPTIKEVIGHDDIAVPKGRKSDPGPAFPMLKFRSWLGL